MPGSSLVLRSPAGLGGMQATELCNSCAAMVLVLLVSAPVRERRSTSVVQKLRSSQKLLMLHSCVSACASQSAPFAGQLLCSAR